MTDPDTRPIPGVPEARRRRTRWPGWVWVIPLVALAFAGWLAVEEWVVGPRPLTVHFTSVEGIKPGAPVRYKGVQIGSVDSIELDEDLGGATLVLDKSGPTLFGIPAIIFADPAYDITQQVIDEVNKDRPPAPAAPAAATPDTTTPAPATPAEPKK